MEKNKFRKSNLELLRIICMLLIIGTHYAQNGGFIELEYMHSKFSLNHFILIIFGSWGGLGVFGFVAITSYFMIKKNNFNIKKIIYLIIKVFFYCLCFSIIGLLIGNLNYKDVVKEILTPLYPNNYWFITTYIVFYFSIPLIKKALDKLKIIDIKKICILMTLFVPCYNLFWINVGDKIANFIYVFIIIYYFEHSKNNLLEKYSKKGFILITIFLICISSIISIFGTILNNNSILNYATQFTSTKNIFIIFDAIFMFYMFKNINIPYSKIINTLAKTTLGIYIIHDNLFFRKYPNQLLWDDILKIHSYYNSHFFLIHIIISILLIFIICSIIELIRILIVDKLILNKCVSIDKYSSNFNQWYLEEQSK